MAILAVAVVITAVLLTVMNKSNNENEEINNPNVQQSNLIKETGEIDSTATEYFDAEKIIESQVIENENMDESEVSVLEYPIFSIPKDVSDIEMMTKEEKLAMGLDENLNIQILGRNEEGIITGYQFINSEEDFVLDLR